MISAKCHPALAPILPRPVAARVPEWVRAMPSETPAATLGGDMVRTLKHCPPFLDAMGLGVLMPLAADLHVSDGEVSWDWDPPHLPDTVMSRAPVGVHVPEQMAGAPFRLSVNSVLKFMNFWTLQVPEGWSLLFTHPLNREDLPFRTLSGIVDCDRFSDGYVHFPALWTDPGFDGTLPAGTPVAQVVAVRRAAPELQIGTMSETEIARNRAVQTALHSASGVYRKDYRR